MKVELTDTERETLHGAVWVREREAAVEGIVTRRVAEALDSVIDGIEETFLPHLPSKALSYCAQEDINTGLDALRERFGVGDER